MTRLVVVLALAMSLARPAHADRNTTVMVEPLYLVIGMVDSTIEYAVTPRVGLAAIAGYGKPMFAATIYDAGAMGNVYLQRDFVGLHLGAELRYMWGDVSIPFVTDTSKMQDSREQIAGGYVGYKWITSYGLSAVLQAGLGHIDVRGPDPMHRFVPIANLNVGWSF